MPSFRSKNNRAYPCESGDKEYLQTYPQVTPNQLKYAGTRMCNQTVFNRIVELTQDPTTKHEMTGPNKVHIFSRFESFRYQYVSTLIIFTFQLRYFWCSMFSKIGPGSLFRVELHRGDSGAVWPRRFRNYFLNDLFQYHDAHEQCFIFYSIFHLIKSTT